MRLRLREPIFSSTIFTLTTVLVLIALVLRPASRDPKGEPALLYEIGAGNELLLTIPASSSNLRVVSRILISPNDPVLETVAPLDYVLLVTWLDADGEVRSASFSERSSPSWRHGIEEKRVRTASVRADERWITDDRSTLIPAGVLVPKGGAIRIRAEAGGRDALLRAFTEAPRDPLEVRRSMIAPTLAEQAEMREQSGVSDWTLLDETERSRILTTFWRSLEAVRAGDGRDAIARRATLTGVSLDPAEREVRDLAIAPRRSVAVNLRGPVVVRLSGGDGIAQLTASLIADSAPGEPPAGIVEAPSQPLGFFGETKARELRIATGTVFSLVIGNPGTETVPLFLSIDHPKPVSLFGGTVAVPLSRAAPAGPLAGRNAILLAPEVRRFEIWRIGSDENIGTASYEIPGFGPADILQIVMRPFIAGPDDLRPRKIEIVSFNDEGKELRRETAEVTSPPSPFEALRAGETTSWVAEPTVLYLAVVDGVSRIVLTTPDDLAIQVSGLGPLEGDDKGYPLPNGTMRVRYRRRPLEPWHPLTPSNREELMIAGRFVQLEAMTRLEPANVSGSGNVDRSYATVEPNSEAARDSARVWLAPGAAGVLPESLWCRFRPEGDTEQVFLFPDDAAARFDGVLTGVIHAEAASLGEPFSVRLDGERMESGLIRQRVERISEVRAPARTQVRFEGPAGSSLWLKTYSPGEPCANAHRAYTAIPVADGASAAFTVNKRLPEQLLLLGGVGAGDALLDVSIDKGRLKRNPGLQAAFTRPARQLLLGGSATTALALLDPDARAMLLEPRALLLGPELPAGRHLITVTNRSGRPLSLWAAIESPDASEPLSPTSPRWVHSEEERDP